MKAARLYQVGTPLKVEEVSEPTLKPGGVIVKILSALIPPFTHQVISGEAGYAFPPMPFTPGTSAIGVIEAIAEDVFGLQAGQLVFCDQYITVNAEQVESILMGWTGLTENSGRLQSLWKDGAFAQKALFPAQCLTPLTAVQQLKPTQLAYLGYLAIPYGGFLRGELRPGQTVIINGATGGLGAAAVMVALAMGAAKIVAVGRDQTILEQLMQIDPKRVVSAPVTGDTSEYSQRIRHVGEGADLVLDVLGNIPHPDLTSACITALRPGGTAVWMGGVKADIPLPYPQMMLKELTIRGAFMFPRSAPAELMQMTAAGTLNLNAVHTLAFNLDQINEAIDKAASFKGFNCCVLTPNYDMV